MSPKEIELSARIEKLSKENRQLERAIEKFYDLLDPKNSLQGIDKDSLKTADNVLLLLKMNLHDLESTIREKRQLLKMFPGK